MKPVSKRKISTPITPQPNEKRKKLEDLSASAKTFVAASASAKKIGTGPTIKTSPRKNVSKPLCTKVTKSPVGRSGKLSARSHRR